MSTMYVVSKRGDTELRWEPSDTKSVAKAREAFDEYRSANYLAFSGPDPAGEHVYLDEFDPSAGEIILTRPLIGG
jgi:hypothetical protein